MDMAWNGNGTTPVLSEHAEWLRMRKANPAPLAALQLYRRSCLLGSYTQREAAALARCSVFDLGVVDAASDEVISDLAADRISMEQLRCRHRARRGAAARMLGAMGPEVAYAWLDDLTAPSR